MLKSPKSIFLEAPCVRPGLVRVAVCTSRAYWLHGGLLRFTDMTVDEVGVAVGMGDANYFSRMFRKVEGISPREYRKQW